MNTGTYELLGVVRNTNGKPEFVVIDFADVSMRGTLNTIDMKAGDLLRAGRIESMLQARYKAGDFLVATVFIRGDGKNRKVYNFKKYNAKEYGNMSNRFIVSILTVKSEVPDSITNVAKHFAGAQSLVRVAWVQVAKTGVAYPIAYEMDLDAAEDAVNVICDQSNAYAVVNSADDGSLVYDPHTQRVAVTVAAPAKVAEVAAPVVVPGKPYFFVEPDAAVVFNMVQGLYDGGYKGAYNLLITGPSGTGKTSIARTFAAKTGRVYHRLNCSLITDPSEFAGQRTITNGNTGWEWSAVANAIMKGNAVIVLDEINRAYPNAMNVLFSLLDEDRCAYFGSELLTVGENVVFVATMNEGSEYTGTFQMDAALGNRFGVVLKMGNIPADREADVLVSEFSLTRKIADDIVRIATQLRMEINATSFPIRTTKEVARLVASGMSQRAAWEYVVVNRVPDSMKQDVVNTLNQKIGVYVVETAKTNGVF